MADLDNRYFSGLLIALVICLVLLSGCAKKTVVVPKPLEEGTEKAEIQEEELGAAASPRKGLSRRGVTAQAQAYGPEGIAFESEDVYFEYDQYTLTPAAQELLQQKAAFLRKHPEVRVTIEGHCDERGSTDYNLGLGQRRADSVKSYLANLGISGRRLATVSYGEEQPAVPGHTEEAWAKNRRAHLVIGSLTD